ncbi:MAG: DUF2125 domain-containing protein [Roseitalea sp.]|jgi:hypothetical protein|nr:DUF2125 domain-containing protein [Roseitalea sp.]MBO6720932.1 DUF2125 domain-containing protein [Roseitalea sp.]MBO6743237.1 DUF2125 domain-containing protein [Roseitalea sp.]
MSGVRKKPSYDAGRRIRWLMIAVVAAVAVYSGGWFWAAGMVDQTVTASANDDNAPVRFSCPGQDVRGFPFRIGVFCEAVEVAAVDGSFALSGGAVRSAAQIYDLRRVVAEIDSPVTIFDAAGTAYRFDWSAGRINAVTAPMNGRMAALEADDIGVRVEPVGDVARADSLGLYVREQGAALDVAMRPRALTVDPVLVGGRDLPPVGLDIDLRLEDWASTWASGPVATGRGTVNRAALLLTNDRGVIADGPFSLSADGLISGEFSVRIVDVPGVLAAARDVFPELAPQIETLAAAASGQASMPSDELSLSLTVREGRVFAGLLPLGRIPPVRLGLFSGL